MVGVWFAVESAYEEREIEEKLPELTRVRESIDITLRNAAAALLP